MNTARSTCLARLALLIVALGVAACGSDDEADGGTASSSTSRDEQQIRTAVSTLGSAMESADGQRACRQLSKQARQTFASVGGDCATGFEQQLSASGLTEDLDPRVVSVEVQGSQATVEAIARPLAAPGSSKREGARLTRATFVKEDGAWKAQEWFRD